MKAKSGNHLRGRVRDWIISAAVIQALYHCLLLTDGFFFGGDVNAALIALIGGLTLSITALLIYRFAPGFKYLPVVMGVLTQLMLLAFGIWHRELNYYYIVMLLVVCSVTSMRDFKQQAVLQGITFVIDLFALIFIFPRFEWINMYVFFMYFVLFICGTVFLLVQVYHVTSRETRSEKALAAFSALLKSTPNLMAVTDTENKVLYLSDRMAEFINFTSMDLAVGRLITDLIEDRELKQEFDEMLASDDLYESITQINTNGEERYYKITSDKMEGGLNGKFIDITDVTTTVRSEKAAMEANKSKTDFLAVISHEIRSPLNVIIGIVQIQMQNKSLPADYSLALEKISNSSNSLMGIINDILDMSKIETGKLELHPEEYDTASMINDAVQLNIVRIGSKPIDFQLEVSESLPARLYGDELRIKQILNNLLSNAIKYTHQGFVKLTVDCADRSGDSVALILTVEDSGQGMKPEDVERLFSEYIRFNETANRKTEGTGLGLNITRRLVNLMDGSINIKSEYGKGSVFVAELMQQRVSGGVIGAEVVNRLRDFTFYNDQYKDKETVSTESMPYGNVLIVDDVETNLYVAVGLLRPYQLNIETARSGFEAIDLVTRGHAYDIIFMDHMMPEMDGIETTERLRGMGYNRPVVALTANALTGNDEMFINHGFDGYIPKPINLRQLDAVLQTFIRDRHEETVETVTVAADAKLIKVFCSDARAALTAMRNAILNDDMKTVCAVAHGIKTALANIGEAALSSRAAALEKAGGRGADDFIYELETLYNRLNSNEETGDSSVVENTAFLNEQLEKIVSACEEYDERVVYAALNRLKERQWQPGTAGTLEEIGDLMFLQSDFEAARARALELIGK
jgi:PAS domain S-box-containing protein